MRAMLQPVAVVLCMAMLLGGCIPFAEPTPLVVGPNGETATPTPNETQRAIVVMLTQTRAAPTVTDTPIVTATITPTPTATTPPQGSSERPVAVGARVAVDGAALVVLSAKTVTEVPRRKAAQGSAFLDVEVVIENAVSPSAGEQAEQAGEDYTPLYFRLVDAQGTAYQPISGGVWPAMQSGALRAGEWVRGHITFEIPAPAGGDLAGMRLRYSPEAAGGGAVEAWIDLSLTVEQAGLPEREPVMGLETGTLPVTGQRDESGGIALTIGRASAGQRIGPTKAGAGNLLVALDVTIENVSRASSPFNAEYFSARDGEGYEYPAVIIPVETVLGAGSLSQGEKVSGQVVFEIPEGTRRLVVEYQPQVLVEEYPVIRFRVDVPR